MREDLPAVGGNVKMHESSVRTVAHPPDETLFDQRVDEIARSSLMERHALSEIIDTHAFPSSNLRERPELRAGDRHRPAHQRVVPAGRGVNQSQALKRLKLSEISLGGLNSIAGLNVALRPPICPACANTSWPATLRGRCSLQLHSVTHNS